ncbi:spermatogenesis-associated protein 2-like protein [Pogona vitticeps]
MTPSAVLQEEYCRCVERDFRRGHAGVCTDPSLKEMLWHSLLENPELHRDLQGEDLFEVFAAALKGHLDLREVLLNLSKAFEVLELAAINLSFFPWRKEFGTIKTFSGVYVHVLQGVLPEADITKSFRRLGYVPRDNFRLVLSKLPPGSILLSAACGFFAARVECEILGKLVASLEPCVVSPNQLLQARRESDGSLEGSVAKLRSLVRWRRSREISVEPTDEVDLYQESLEGQSPRGEASGARLSSQHVLAPPECVASPNSPRLHLWNPPQLPEQQGRLWASGQDQPHSNGVLGSEGPDLETSFSIISLRSGLSTTTDTDYTAQPSGGWFLSPGASCESSALQPHGANPPAAPSTRSPRSPQLSPVGARRAVGLGAANEPPCYHLHACLRPGALPASCCNTCRALHGPGCEGAQACRGRRHHVEELHSEKQKRLWLQRMEVDQLLQEGGGAWQ